MGLMYCKNCGEANDDDYLYCTNCGHVLEQTKEESFQLEVRRKGRQIGKLIAIFLSVVLVMAGVSVVVVFYVDSERQKMMERFIVETQDIEKDYLNAQGYVDEIKRSAVIDAVYSYAQSLQENKEVASCEKSASGVVIRQKSGETFLYMPETAELNAGGSDGKIVTLQPSQKEFSQIKSISKELKEAPDTAAKALQEFSDFYSFLSDGTSGDDNRDNSEVTLEFIKSLNQYSVVIWDGHGGNWDDFGIVLGTTISYKEIRSKYISDINKGFIAKDSKGHAVVSHHFFEKYLGDFPKTSVIVYIGSCSSGATSDLADAFLDKGASAVFANSSTVHTEYDLKMIQSVFGALATLKNKKAQTVSAALKYAQQKNGAQDTAIDGVKAKVLIFGDKNATLCYEKTNPSSGTQKTTKKTAPKIDYTSSKLTGDFNTDILILKARLLVSTLQDTSNSAYQWDIDGDSLQDITLFLTSVNDAHGYYASVLSNKSRPAYDFSFDVSVAGDVGLYYSEHLKKVVYRKTYSTAGFGMDHYTVQSGLNHNYLASSESKFVAEGKPRAEKYNIKGSAVKQKQYEQYEDSLKLVPLREYTADISENLPSALCLPCAADKRNELLERYANALSSFGFLIEEAYDASGYRFSTNMSIGSNGDLSSPNGITVNIWQGGSDKMEKDDGTWKRLSQGWRNTAVTVSVDKDGLVFLFEG